MLKRIFENGAGDDKIVVDGLEKGTHNGNGVVVPFNRNVTALTRREMQILAMASLGLNSGQIAQKLTISPATVEKHRNNMLKKMKAPNVTEAVARALRNGWIE